MSCENCGQPAQGDLCKLCRGVQGQADRGTPAEIMERRETADSNGGDHP